MNSSRDSTSGGRRLVVLGQAPPPLHGQAIAIKVMVDGLHDRLDLEHVPMRFSETVYDNGRLKFGKVLHLFEVMSQALWLLIRHPGSVLYFPPAPASWVPVIRDLVLLSVLRPFAAKTIFHLHSHGIGQFLQDRPWLSRLTWAWRRPDVAVVMGHSCSQDALKLSPGVVHVVPYGLDAESVARRRPRDGTIRVVYVGMLAESKGVFDLLETAARLKHLDLEFHIIGTYKYAGTRARFEQRLADLNLGGRVQLLGKRSGRDLQQRVADADIFFFPTYFESETFGIVTLEAMAQALPVVASRWRGPADIVQDGETGILCEPRDVQAFADAIELLASDSKLREKLGARGLQRCQEKFRVADYLDGMERIFRDSGCGNKDDSGVKQANQNQLKKHGDSVTP